MQAHHLDNKNSTILVNAIIYMLRISKSGVLTSHGFVSHILKRKTIDLDVSIHKCLVTLIMEVYSSI
jgi:hypothetical protein